MDEVLSWEGGLPPHSLSLSNSPVAFKRHLVPAFPWRGEGQGSELPCCRPTGTGVGFWAHCHWKPWQAPGDGKQGLSGW